MMDGHCPESPDIDQYKVDRFPSGLTGGLTVLVASTSDPSQYAIGLRMLSELGTADDTAFVVTTAEGADDTADSYESLCGSQGQPSLRIADTTSKQQSLSAVFGETPVVFTPSPGDLERLVIALSDLSENGPPSAATRHLVVRSLTPILEDAPTDRVSAVLDRITGLRSETGLCLLGISYTAHDKETIDAVIEHVDGILWVSESAAHRLEIEYRPLRRHYPGSTPY